MFGASAKLDTDVFIQKMEREHPEYLFAHELRIKLFRKVILKE